MKCIRTGAVTIGNDGANEPVFECINRGVSVHGGGTRYKAHCFTDVLMASGWFQQPPRPVVTDRRTP